MIYTIGFPEIYGMRKLRTDETICPSKEDVLLLNAVGDRFLWKSISLGKFQLCHILPTPTQIEWIMRLLDVGGKVITSLVNPQKPMVIPVFKEELKNFSYSHLDYKDYGFLYEIRLFPYDWLLKTKFESLPMVAYESFKKNKTSFYTILEGDLPSFKRVINYGYSFEVGHNKGKIIFTPLLNNNFCLDHDNYYILQKLFWEDNHVVEK